MIDRIMRRTLWLMLAGMLIAFIGVFIYANIGSSLGYAIGVAGVMIMGVGVAANIALYVSRHKKNNR